MFIGIDLGTSGCRAIAIDEQARIQGEARVALAAPISQGNANRQAPALWWEAVCEVLSQLSEQIPAQQVQAIAVDGTSATVLVTDAQGAPLGQALMYNDASCQAQAEQIQTVAPPSSAARSVTASLAKLLYLYQQYPQARHALHQADWISNRLSGKYGVSDANNCLKLGYDGFLGDWEEWLQQLDFPQYLLPKVLPAGTLYAVLRSDLARRWGFSANTHIVTGTTDSTAAFLATGAQQIGDAVTVLGSTLVLKILSEKPINAPEYGVYSQRLGHRWLIGGASNSGAAVLLQYFTDQQLAQMTPNLKAEQPSGLDYYPLPAVGERFPIADAQLAPRLSPRPPDDVLFFQGILEGLSQIEAQAYARLHALGAPALNSVRTVGGGAKNAAWQQMRQAVLDVPIIRAQHSEAAYGAALLAKSAHLTGSCWMRC